MELKWYLRNEGMLVRLHSPFAWALDQIFEIGDLSSHGGVTYFAKVAHVAVAAYEPGTGADWGDVFESLAIGAVGPQGNPGGTLAWHGVYDADHAYQANDGVISSEGRGCYALQATTGNAPPSYPTLANSYWSVFAEKGVGGIQADGSVPMTGALTFTQITTPTEPGASKTAIYAKSDGKLYWFSNGGAETEISGVDDGSGWKAAGETWVYAGGDDPTYTFTIAGVDKTTKYYAGMKIKLAQSTGGVKYGIITKVAFSTNTTVNVYFGTDYNLENESITSPYFSTAKSPAGFPCDPEKWTVTTTSTSDDAQASPAQNTIYNLGSRSISIPIGAWVLSYDVASRVIETGGNAQCDIWAGLSTANNSFSNARFVRGQMGFPGPSGGIISLHMRDSLTLTAKTAYYLNGQTTTATIDSITWLGTKQTTVIKAICAYL